MSDTTSPAPQLSWDPAAYTAEELQWMQRCASAPLPDLMVAAMHRAMAAHTATGCPMALRAAAGFAHQAERLGR